MDMVLEMEEVGVVLLVAVDLLILSLFLGFSLTFFSLLEEILYKCLHKHYWFLFLIDIWIF